MSGQHDDSDAAWRAIVENYGERPALDDPEPEPPRAPEPFAEEEPDDEDLWPEDRFVPPEPPPLPHPPPVRMAAWIGVLGSPAFLLLALLAGITLPGWLGYGLILAFLGGFAYLVLHMRRGPRDPWDDGAQV